MNFCTVYLTRHAQTDWNVRKIIQGHLDIPLNEEGKVQAHQAAEEFKDITLTLFTRPILPERGKQQK